MLFVQPEDNQSVYISKHNLADGPFTLILEHNLTHARHEFDNLIDKGYKSGYWIFIGLDFRDLESGEYTYSLIAANGYQKERGLLQVMTPLRQSVSYNSNINKTTYNG